jgi:ABC-type proline/glycine betaine transport system permease subunit
VKFGLRVGTALIVVAILLAVLQQMGVAVIAAALGIGALCSAFMRGHRHTGDYGRGGM